MNHIACHTRGSWTVVSFESSRLTDPIALYAVERELMAALEPLPAASRVVICLEGVEYVSSQVAGILLAAKKLVVNQRRGRLALCRVGDHLAEMLRMTRLETQFEIKPRLRDVLGQDAGPQRIPVKRREPEMAVASAPRSRREMEWID